jgi:hypothetical protein
MHSPIELVSDSYENLGVPRGTRGYILDVYGTKAYLAQFFDKDHDPIDWFEIKQYEAHPIDVHGVPLPEQYLDR